MSAISLLDQVVPPPASDEIPRDALVRQVAAGFGPACQTQVIVGGVQTGKTVVLAQFARSHGNRCISYFISASPLTQRQHAFLFSMCMQMSLILGTRRPPESIGIEDLKSLFSSLSFSL